MNEERLLRLYETVFVNYVQERVYLLEFLSLINATKGLAWDAHNLSVGMETEGSEVPATGSYLEPA
jgi:hypothetical protein